MWSLAPYLTPSALYRQNGDHVEPDARHKLVTGQDTHTLVVLEPTADDCGPFECVAINASGEARCQAEVGGR